MSVRRDTVCCRCSRGAKVTASKLLKYRTLYESAVVASEEHRKVLRTAGASVILFFQILDKGCSTLRGQLIDPDNVISDRIHHDFAH